MNNLEFYASTLDPDKWYRVKLFFRKKRFSNKYKTLKIEIEDVKEKSEKNETKNNTT